MKRTVLSAFLLVLAFPLIAAPQTEEWSRFSPSGLNFSALFPGTPVEEPQSVDKRSDGSVDSTTYLYYFQGGGFYCGVGVSDYTFTVNVENELTANRDNFLKSVDGTLLTSQRGEFINGSEKLPELTFTFEIPKIDYRGKSIVIIRGNRTYMALAAISKDAPDNAFIERFLDSFKFTSNP